MKLFISALFLFSLSTSLFAQESLFSTTMITLSPTLSTVEVFGDASESLGLSAITTFASSYASIEEKGAHAQNELREEGAMVVDLLVNGKTVQMKNFKTLSAMIDKLKYNEVTRLEIQEAANQSEVSFEIMALKAILLSTEI